VDGLLQTYPVSHVWRHVAFDEWRECAFRHARRWLVERLRGLAGNARPLRIAWK